MAKKIIVKEKASQFWGILENFLLSVKFLNLVNMIYNYLFSLELISFFINHVIKTQWVSDIEGH